MFIKTLEGIIACENNIEGSNNKNIYNLNIIVWGYINIFIWKLLLGIDERLEDQYQISEFGEINS